MRLLLDTHTLLWLLVEPHKLPPVALDKICSTENQVSVSIVSLWEIAIKTAKGNLDVTHSGISKLDQELKLRKVGLLSVELRHLIALESLAPHHKALSTGCCFPKPYVTDSSW